MIDRTPSVLVRRVAAVLIAAAGLLGAALAGGMIVGFVASRTVGLFGYSSDEWAEGIPSLVVQTTFLALAARYVLQRRATTGGRQRSVA